jgi:hypothetical protein
MQVGEQYSGRRDPATADAAGPLRRRAGSRDPATARRWAAAGWIGGTLTLTALLARISLASPVNSDGANIAFQAWDLLHGHLLLHGWVTADASYYTFELPQFAVAEVLFGLTVLTCHIVSALTYAIVAALGIALARRNSGGAAAAARSGVVLAILAAPILAPSGVAILLEAPQHIGTSAYLLGTFLLIDRAPGWRFTAPLTGVILAAGQVGDATVLYVGVPAVVLVCLYRAVAGAVAARKIRKIVGADLATAVAAAVSGPLALLCRAVMRYFGGYAVVPPRTAVTPRSVWLSHAAVCWQDVRTLFGAAVTSPGTGAFTAAVFGWACLVAAALGLARVTWTWRRASHAEQLLAVAIAVNVVIYVISNMATTTSSREIAAVLPCGAVLAARAFVPRRIEAATRARAALAVASAAAVVPLAAAATQPVAPSEAVPLAAWLTTHNLRYGIAGYWDASAVTLQSGNRVLIRAVSRKHDHFVPYYWETKPSWYSASLHDATFVIADTNGGYPNDHYTISEIKAAFGRPARIYWVAGRQIMVYRENLLGRLGRPEIPSPTGKLQ